MRVLIVYAHPEPRSFVGALRDSACEVLGAAGHTVIVSDLYEMGFDAAGGPRDFTALSSEGPFGYLREQARASADGGFAPELAAEITKLKEADTVIFLFPLWWFGLPAILKGWVDRVFAFGFAYGPAQRLATGPLRGKKAMVALTTGAPAPTFTRAGVNGSIHALLFPIQYGTLHWTGMDVLPPFVAYGAARVDAAARTAYLDEWRDRLGTLATTPPLLFDPSDPRGAA
jgi:NAD(P)H dehydrogenase (quinone)